MPDKRLAEIAARYAESFIAEISDLNCESPIEELMAAGLIFQLKAYSADYYGYECEITSEDPFYSWEQLQEREPGFLIVGQCKIGPYTADFLIRYAMENVTEFAIIECDGHEFHEKTKHQAKHDKQRDRYFQGLGIKVLRFTGSEIHADPVGCAKNALDIVSGRTAKQARRA